MEWATWIWYWGGVLLGCSLCHFLFLHLLSSSLSCNFHLCGASYFFSLNAKWSLLETVVHQNWHWQVIDILLIIGQIFRALSYIHRAIGVCHRDIKPQNLLVWDFGMYKFYIQLCNWSEKAYKQICICTEATGAHSSYDQNSIIFWVRFYITPKLHEMTAYALPF